MPRRALSTLRAEIKDGGPSGTSMEGVSTDVGSSELLTWNLRSFVDEKEMEPFLVVGSGIILLGM